MNPSKLKFKHIYLTAFSKMRVDLAAQVKKSFIANFSSCMDDHDVHL